MAIPALARVSLKFLSALTREMQKPLEAGIRGNSGSSVSSSLDDANKDKDICKSTECTVATHFLNSLAKVSGEVGDLGCSALYLLDMERQLSRRDIILNDQSNIVLQSASKNLEKKSHFAPLALKCASISSLKMAGGDDASRDMLCSSLSSTISLYSLEFSLPCCVPRCRS